MKYYKFKPILLGIFSYFLFSCNKDLNLVPPDTVSSVSFWNTPADFKLAANYFYVTALPGPGPLDQESDIQYGTGINSISSGTNLPTANDGFWNASYTYIRAANSLLEKAKEYSKPDEIKVYAAEAKFFRAYLYFNLVYKYGDVPYFDELLYPGNEEIYKARTGRDAIITNILRDLDAAIPDLPLAREVSSSDQGRITRGAAQALESKVALFEATWAKYHNTAGNVNDLLDKAIIAANALINSGQYSLYEYAPDPKLSYGMSYSVNANDSKEQILARRYSLNIVTHNWSNQVLAGLSNGTKALVDMYLCIDGLPIDKSPLFKGYSTMVSEFENRDLRMSNTLNIPGAVQWSSNNRNGNPSYPEINNLNPSGYMANKFVDANADSWEGGKSYTFHTILKYSEVLLTLAEALYERNGVISDEDLNRTINLLRDRAGVAPLTNDFITANNLNALQEIRRERGVELAWDGVRLGDLKRWGTAVSVLGQAIKGINVGSGAWDSRFPGASAKLSDSEGFLIVQPASTRLFSDKNYLFPIPTQEIQLNPSLKQNPGW